MLKTDYVISSWIINSISKELVNAFSHIDTTKKLWDALTQRFGRCNGPKVYKLQREIFGYSQGSQTIVEYFNNLSALWDELDMLLPPLDCNCHARKQAVKKEEQQKLVKFLHGLNVMYERARSQILLLEPLPSVDRAYAMIIQVEDELSLYNDIGEGQHMMAMNAEGNHSFAVGGKQNMFKKRLTKEEKKRLKCKHCHEPGHEMDEYCKLYRVPDWYRRYKENRDKHQANYVDNDDRTSSYGGYEQRSNGVDISKLVQTELSKYLTSFNTQQGGNDMIQQGKNDVNLVQTKQEGAEFFT